MHSSAQAIVWEICAKNRWTLAFAFGLIPFCALCEWITPPGHESIGVLQAFGAIATFVSIVWVCSYTANDPRGSFSGFPSWMYTLPRRTSALVIVPMLLGIAFMLAAVLAWQFTIAAYWKEPVPRLRIAWHALIAIATLVTTQALVWSLHRFRWIRVVALIAAMYTFLYLCLVGVLWNFAGGAALWFGGVFAILVLAIIGGIAGVERDRHGLWQGWTGKLLEYLLDLLPRRSGAFSSPAHAQLWFEWRRRGAFSVIVFGVTMALWLLTYPLSAALYLGPIETLFNFSGPFFGMVLMAGILGNAIGKPDTWARDLIVPCFAATKPVSTSALVFAKMKTAALVTIASWILFCALLPLVIWSGNRIGWQSEQAPIFWHNFPTNYPAFWRWVTNPFVMLAIVAASWHTMAQSMAVVLTGNRRRVALSSWQGILVIGAVFSCALWLYWNRSWLPSFLRWLPWFTAAFMALKIFAAVRSFQRARQLVSARDFQILVMLWVLVGALALAAGIAASVSNGLPPAILWLLVLWQFFPDSSIPECVVSLARNRHR